VSLDLEMDLSIYRLNQLLNHSNQPLDQKLNLLHNILLILPGLSLDLLRESLLLGKGEEGIG